MVCRAIKGKKDLSHTINVVYLTPVSYTHLDVYKRQVVFCATNWLKSLYALLYVSLLNSTGRLITATLYLSFMAFLSNT